MKNERTHVDSKAAESAPPDVANDVDSAITRPDNVFETQLPESGEADTVATDESTLSPKGNADRWDTIPETCFNETSSQLPAPSSISPGRFGDYELISEIARGGMGVVYKARQVKLNRPVALKMILSGQLASEEEVQRFYTEAEAAANLEHPGIIPIFEIGQHEGQHFFSMRLIEGKSLEDRLKDGPIAPREAAEITKQIAEAIDYAHGRNVIHRDLKPANVLVDGNGDPKVTDFGLAKKTEISDGLTATGQVLGTAAYMSPEQATGQTQQVGPRSDVYSIGALLYALLTGRPPFQAANVIDTLKQVIDQDPVPPTRLNSAIHADLETICLKCLSKTQSNRYQSAGELGEELDRFLNGQAIQAKASTVLSRTWSVVLSESRHTEVLKMWSKVWWWHAIIVLVLTVITCILQWANASPLVMAIAWIPFMTAILLVVWQFRFRAGGNPIAIEKQIAQVWAMFGVTAILTGIINHQMNLETLQLVPMVALECGLAFCCMAAILGGSFYPIGIACFAVAVMMPLVPNFAAAIFGLLIATGLLIPAIKYSRTQE